MRFHFVPFYYLQVVIICRPQIKISELHPEEEAILPISEDEWFDMFNESGQIENDLLLRKVRFKV